MTTNSFTVTRSLSRVPYPSARASEQSRDAARHVARDTARRCLTPLRGYVSIQSRGSCLLLRLRRRYGGCRRIIGEDKQITTGGNNECSLLACVNNRFAMAPGLSAPALYRYYWRGLSIQLHVGMTIMIIICIYIYTRVHARTRSIRIIEILE